MPDKPEQPDHSLAVKSPAYRQRALTKARDKWTGKLVAEGYSPDQARKKVTAVVRRIDREYSDKSRGRS